MFGLAARTPGRGQTRHDDSPYANASDYLAEQDLSESFALSPRGGGGEATLICQISCLKDVAVTAASDSISQL